MKPVLIFMCGERGSGKSMLAKKLSEDRSAVLLSVDEWVCKVGHPVEGLKDYARYYRPCKELIERMAMFEERQRKDPANAMKEETLREIAAAGYKFIPPGPEEGFNVKEIKR